MIVIIGLGNPGQRYKKTRHNIGFRVVDKFLEKNNFPVLKLSKKFLSLISENKEIILAKPQTFMNKSGEAVKSLFNFYKPEILIVIHDDIDLPLGKIKISKSQGSAGHKGVESIIEKLGNKNFIRIRIGLQPKQYHRLVCGTEKFVLQKFTKQEEAIIEKIIQKSVEAIEFLTANSLEKTMNKFNV